MRIGSLFAGVGGLELGLERAGVGRVRWQVEIDPFCQKVLARHWPTTQRFQDVKECSRTNLDPVDLVCGGFPCQDMSSAGKRAGLTGARSGLWFEYLRIVGELKPCWVVVENVASGAHAWVDTVLSGLGQLGYMCLPIPIAAADVGAPHLRQRVFIVAHLDARTEHVSALNAEAFSTPTASAEGHWTGPMPDMVRVVHGLPRRLDSPRKRIAALGNSVVPQCAEVVGWVIRHLNEPSG